MSSPILTAKNAEDLNNLVRDLIDPRLFLLCNYEPTVRHVIGEDGRYLLNIQDLYKFTLDCGNIIKQYFRIIPKSNRWQFKRLEVLMEHISMFRTVFDHNISSEDGQLSKEHMDAYLAWVHKVIGKSEPDTVDDFRKLNRELESMAVELLQLLDKFVRSAARIPDQNKVVSDWLDMILHWFCNNTKRDIYWGHLLDAYIANTRAAGRNTDDLHRVRVANGKIKRWIEKALLHPVQEKIDEANRNIELYEGMLRGENPMFEAMRAKQPPAKVAEAENRFRLTIGQLQQEILSLTEDLNALQNKIGRDSSAYFFNNLERQLRDTMEALENDGIYYTMLPQDLIQEDIARIFGAVRSPDGDF